MTKLHELIAVEPELKGNAQVAVSEVTDLFTKGTIRLVGQVRKYNPLEENGEKFSDETTELATTVTEELKQLRKIFGHWVDVAIQKEVTNGHTSADVMVDGKTILTGLGAPALLNLEKKLETLRMVYGAIPTNDLSERWEFDSQQGIYVSVPRDSYRTKKIPKALVMYPATTEHPAQVQSYTEDVREGIWTTTKRSGMISPIYKRLLLDRIDTLLRAVVTARQRANDVDASQAKVAEKIFDYIHRE